MALCFGLAWFATELASKPQRISSLICRSNYHQWIGPFHGLEFGDCSAEFSWTSCRSSGRWLLTKGSMGTSWSLTGQQYHSPASWAAKGRQKAPGGTSRGMAHVIRPGLGREEHMRQSLQWPSSFGEVGLADLDVPFAAWTMAKLGPSIHAWRHRQLRAVTMLSRAVEPLQRALVRGMFVDVRERAEKWVIAPTAAIIPLPRWPDRKVCRVFRRRPSHHWMC